ncbi:MAG: type II toxin-antitoxin system YafQ family toxin [Proteobacteria bacterium]|nr:type II toxin-antitoxin system YafQ family toxin [Pseudomonadota bacterium]
MAAPTQPRVVYVTGAFRKDLKRAARHRKCNLSELQRVMEALESRHTLDAKYLDHALTGRYPDQKGGYTDCRECHTSNDWLLVYRLPDEAGIHFIRCGTHSELF